MSTAQVHHASKNGADSTLTRLFQGFKEGFACPKCLFVASTFQAVCPQCRGAISKYNLQNSSEAAAFKDLCVRAQQRENNTSVLDKTLSKFNTGVACSHCDFASCDLKLDYCPQCKKEGRGKQPLLSYPFNEEDAKGKFFRLIDAGTKHLCFHLTGDNAFLNQKKVKGFGWFPYMFRKWLVSFLMFVGWSIPCFFVLLALFSFVHFIFMSAFPGLDLYHKEIRPILESARNETAAFISGIDFNPESQNLQVAHEALQKTREQEEQLKREKEVLARQNEQLRIESQLNQANFHRSIADAAIRLDYALELVSSDIMWVQLKGDSALYASFIKGYPEMKEVENHWMTRIKVGNQPPLIVFVPSLEALDQNGRNNSQFRVVEPQNPQNPFRREPFNELFTRIPELADRGLPYEKK